MCVSACVRVRESAGMYALTVVSPDKISRRMTTLINYNLLLLIPLKNGLKKSLAKPET